MSTRTPSMEQTIAALRTMSAGQLREKYVEVFGEPSRSGNKDYLFKKIAWRVQSLAEGGLSERARRRAEELARDADIRTTIPRPPKVAVNAPVRTTTLKLPTPHDRLPIPGTLLTRTYRGKHVAVTVLADGFDYEGQVYRSLSAVAKVVTGSHWNGHLFFGLTTHKRDRI
ncbi:MAG TPA: DUF2924 domain-containing protein [Tepidisphaeraceae bacterium]|nr:DUF2924 domain-containing protein [Tepidisphaeraceae bacterium]